MSRAARVLSCLALIMTVGCSKSPTKPAQADPYAPMYGTWEGRQTDIGSSGTSYPVPDSVRLIVSPGTTRPIFHLWQRKVATGTMGGAPWPWRELAFSPAQVTGTTVGSVADWDGILEAACAPDSAHDSTGVYPLGWRLPGSTWHTDFWPYAPRSGPVTRMDIIRSYSTNVDFPVEETASFQLFRR